MPRQPPDQDDGEALRRFNTAPTAGTPGNFSLITGQAAFLRNHYVVLIL